MMNKRVRVDRVSSFAISMLTAFSLVLQSHVALSADISKASKGDVRFFMDWAGFKSFQDNRKSYVEFYVTLSRDQLTFSQMETGYAGAYEIEIILDREGRKPEKKSWLGAAQIDSLEEASQKISLFDVNYFLLEPGHYTLSAKVADLNSGLKGSYVERLTIPKFKEKELGLSQIEFASRIEAVASQNKFVKNGVFVLPNPLHLYGIQLPAVFFYAEVYNLQHSEGDTSTYTIQYDIIDSTDTVVKPSSPRTFRKNSTSAVVTEQTSCVTLGTGKYTLKLNVTDNETGEQATQEGTFQVRMPRRPVSAQGESDSLLNEEQAQLNRNIISYIATRKELQLYDDFNLDGKKAFLEKFWSDRDPTPGTEINEFKEDHHKRFAFANINFQSTTQKEGWKTDMGRIYILYGPPHDIERHTADAESNAWEKWIYESLKDQGNVFFILGDLEGFGRYTLLHSNLRGEKYDENWEQWINRYRGRY
ncbi:MAG: GWxTD domain-containing protein [Gemmatimonadota bacterium]|nr:MAG: GWxTD domain-containing protein [Gemmatimonadota bacterium]